MPTVKVTDFASDHGDYLQLELLTPDLTLDRPINGPQVQRPGLGLAGFMKKFNPSRIIVFGGSETLYLEELPAPLRKERLESLLTAETPAAVTADIPSEILIATCRKKGIPLFRTELNTIEFLSRANYRLAGDFSPFVTCHGTFIEAFGVGVLIQGDLSIGKSEAALGLLERGHRLISDDVVRLKLGENGEIEGCGPELNKHVM